MTTAPMPSTSVSNLVMSWDPPAIVPEVQPMAAEAPGTEAAPPRMVAERTSPELPAPSSYEERRLAFDAERVLAERRALPQVPRYELLADGPAIAWEDEDDAVLESTVALAADAAPHERRSAYELAFLMLAAALAILVATPPLVQLFLAMRGIQA